MSQDEDAIRTSGKRPRTLHDILESQNPWEDELAGDDDGPDLEEYLSHFTTSDATNIALLRCYANYLASKLKAQREQKKLEK
jgi:hypothetical protein